MAEDPRTFLATYPDLVILDEVQRAPALVTYLTLAIDATDTCGPVHALGTEEHLVCGTGDRIPGWARGDTAPVPDALPRIRGPTAVVAGVGTSVSE